MKRRHNNTQEQHNPAPHERHGTTSDKISVIVNSILAILTLVAIYFAYQANQTSIDSLKYVKHKDSIDNIEQSKKDVIAENERLFNRQYVDSTLAISTQSVNETKKSSKISEQALNETKKSYDFSRESAIKEIRAYMVGDGVRMTNLEPDSVTMEFSFANVGKTPAYKVSAICATIGGYSETSENVIQFMKQVTDNNNMGRPVTVGVNQKMPVNLFIGTYTREYIESVKSGKYKIFVGANIVYYDIFQIPRFTHIFAEYNFNTNSFNNCKMYNDAN